MNKGYYNNEIHKIQINKINKVLKCEISKITKHGNNSHKAKHVPIIIGLLFNGNHESTQDPTR
jgi:hypothetical protein